MGKAMSAKRRHIPLRSCVACRSKQPKRELLRVVALPEGGAQVDATGRQNGRGAYVCAGCAAGAADALRPGRLARALRADIDNGQWQRIAAELAAAVSAPGSQMSAGQTQDSGAGAGSRRI